MSFPNLFKPIENAFHTVTDYFRKKPTTTDEKEIEKPIQAEVPPPVPEQTTPNDVPADSTASTPVVVPKSIVVGEHLDGEARILAAEQVVYLDEKAADLHVQTASEVKKSDALTELNTLIMKLSSESKDGSVDCASKEITELVENLRVQGIQVPLPLSGVIKKADITQKVGQINNICQKHHDEGQRKAQEFQQCTLERNTLFQFVNSVFQAIHQAITKIISHFAMR